MKQYVHTLRDVGIHARSAALIVKLAKEYADSDIIFSCKGKEAKATSLMKLMSLGIQQGDALTITAEGEHEDVAIIAMSEFVNNHL